MEEFLANQGITVLVALGTFTIVCLLASMGRAPNGEGRYLMICASAGALCFGFVQGYLNIHLFNMHIAAAVSSLILGLIWTMFMPFTYAEKSEWLGIVAGLIGIFAISQGMAIFQSYAP